ncbi:MAG: cyclopropane-fatty-acyl-phospholipid synthase [Hyphomicrobiales bacterium]|nr:cyclopropane-fatty-acyl-phospholipid synthase [Hyphomicrobiales bacterium]
MLAGFLSRVIPPISAGRLLVELPSGGSIERAGALPGPDVVVSIHRWRALARLAASGEAGFASSYLDGDWSTADLARLFDLVIVNEAELQLESNFIARMFARLRHGSRRNTRKGSRRNIAEHYDLGNDFYRPWLDESMTYSAALFDGVETLEDAQRNKIDRVADLLDLKGGEQVLEIGCGWGALAENLVRKNMCTLTGLTLSEEQYAYATERLRQEIAAGKAEIRLQDYRDAGGVFDRIVSIEMFEAVGEAYWTTYFDTLKRRLAEGGTAVLQVITIAEERFHNYRRTPDFIQRYIFPGGMLPTKTHMHELAAAAGLRVTAQFSFGEGYSKTLSEWRTRFRAAWPRLEPLGFDDRFRRMWDYYLAYCDVGFRAGATDVTLFQMQKPQYPTASHQTPA